MKTAYQAELFKKLIEHPNWKQEIEIFLKFFGNAQWSMFPVIGKTNFKYQNNVFSKNNEKEKCSPIINKLLHKTKQTLLPQREFDPEFKYVYCLPIIRGDQIYGYVIICNVEKEVPQHIIEIFDSFTRTTIESVQKELELTKLYETIRPRTIALSTVHTINRIISSTLEINELLPRIARLSLQTLRSRKCCIMLVDKQKKFLIPRAIVDSGKKHQKAENTKIGQGPIGMVVKTGKTLFRPHVICVPLVAEEVIIGAISVYFRLDKKSFSPFDKEILTTLAEQAVIAIKNAQLFEEQEKLTLNSIKALANILSSGVSYNYGRTNLFVNITMSIGMELKLSSDHMRILYYSTLLHNVSQMGLPDKILKKSSKLTDKDYKIIREQPLKGVEIIRPIGGKIKSVLPIIIHHHERYDGKGYPSGLKGEQIPLGARILAIADAFEAMLSKRPYRKKMTFSQAVAEIVKYSGEQFDPIIVDAFARVIRRSKNKILKVGSDVWLWKNF